MTKKTGKNIMTLAKVLAWIYGIAGVIVGIAWWTAWDEFWTFLVCVAGGAVMVVMCWPLYGFGRLIDDVNAIRANIAGRTASNVVEADELPEL